MTSPDRLAAVQAAADCYDQTARWDQSWTREDVHVGLRHVAGADVIAFRGSIDEEDWLRDFQGWPRKHPVLGYCHSGFLAGMDTVAAELTQAIDASGRPFVVTGHSLGAARALIVAALLTAGGRKPVLVETYGTPRPGMERLSQILLGGGYPIRAYKNGPDPVAEVPATIPPLLMYRKPVADTLLYVPPQDDAEDPFHWHHMPLYLEGVRALG